MPVQGVVWHIEQASHSAHTLIPDLEFRTTDANIPFLSSPGWEGNQEPGRGATYKLVHQFNVSPGGPGGLMFIKYFEILKAKTLYKCEIIMIIKPLLLNIGRSYCSLILQ